MLTHVISLIHYVTGQEYLLGNIKIYQSDQFNGSITY